LAYGKEVCATKPTQDAAAGLLAVCALVCGFVIFTFYLLPRETTHTVLAAAYNSPSAKLTGHRLPAENQQSDQDETVTRANQLMKPLRPLSPAAVPNVGRAPATRAARIRTPSIKRAYPGYAIAY
jgi:hypothetical protein